MNKFYFVWPRIHFFPVFIHTFNFYFMNVVIWAGMGGVENLDKWYDIFSCREFHWKKWGILGLICITRLSFRGELVMNLQLVERHSGSWYRSAFFPGRRIFFFWCSAAHQCVKIEKQKSHLHKYARVMAVFTLSIDFC